MNLVPIKVAQLKTEIELDPDFLEPLSEKEFKEPIELRAQIVYRTYEIKSPSLTGDIERSDGHLCFRLSDLTRHGIRIRKGDRIVAVKQNGKWKEVDFVIFELRPAGHLPDAKILLAFFKHREEKRESS
jgi:hypothetical protein